MYLLSRRNEAWQYTFPHRSERLPYASGCGTCMGIAQCGEVYFEETEADTIQDVIRLIDEKTERLEVIS